jgi:hypothetical protein
MDSAYGYALIRLFAAAQVRRVPMRIIESGRVSVPSMQHHPVDGTDAIGEPGVTGCEFVITKQVRCAPAARSVLGRRFATGASVRRRRNCRDSGRSQAAYPYLLTGQFDVVAHVLIRAVSRLIGMHGDSRSIASRGRTVCLSRGVPKSRDAARRVRAPQRPAFRPAR